MSRDIYETLTEIVRDVLGDDGIVLTPATAAADVKGWDSVNHVTIAVAAEMRFGVKFHSGELEDLKNVGDLAAIIRRKLDARAG